MEAAVRNRVNVVFALVLLFAAGIGARLVYLQVYCCDRLRGRAIVQHRQELVVPATRGSVLDRHGRELAMSLKTETLFAHPHRVSDPDRAATLLAPVVDVSRGEILSRLKSSKSFVYLHRSLEPEAVETIRRLDLPVGNTEPFGLHDSSKRYYPRGRLGVHVVGFANVDGKGVEGIERQFDEVLSGDPTVFLVVRDGLAGRVRQTMLHSPERKPQDVVLTLDLVLQHIVERELDRAMRETRAASASAILMDPATGEVLALANRPTTADGRYSEASPEERINRAVVHQYEPGSTFKIAAMAAALEQGRVRPEDRFDCERGTYMLRRRVIRDTEPHGVLTAREIFEESSNIGMVKIAESLKAKALRETITRFGFAEPTGIELPGERSGSLSPVSDWTHQTKPSLAFGYEIGVTVLQMASAFATIANDGVRVPPRLVLGLRDAEGHLRRFDPPQSRRAIRSRTASVLGSMMEGVIVRGTGTRAQVAGYRLAGKSGTAKKLVDGVYSTTDYVGSFGGYGPANSPRLVCLVVIDTPRGDEYYGGAVAAPVFRRIMEDALAHLRAPADYEVPTRSARNVDPDGPGSTLR